MSEDKSCDLECAICFSNYNNVFRAPKVLDCGHTFCLECLARMNMKSHVAEAIQCPMCRDLTLVPKDGLPRLGNDPNIVSCLPEAMQRIHSIRFSRNKGKLFVKKGQSSQKKVEKKNVKAFFVRTVSQSLDVGHPAEAGGQRQHGHSCWYWSHNKWFCIVTIIVILVSVGLLISSVWLFRDH
ncbi:RING finger protein 225-like [Hemiscyllium ocellatum]|uniref:RING finger protein 225-like n=1 Tax=Hemiscyllium ocellatum TaxID=170820 RepID=UPI002966EBAB|nr:RING finger protein 225-like [Hemiscyllium ocellatum]